MERIRPPANVQQQKQTVTIYIHKGQEASERVKRGVGHFISEIKTRFIVNFSYEKDPMIREYPAMKIHGDTRRRIFYGIQNIEDVLLSSRCKRSGGDDSVAYKSSDDATTAAFMKHIIDSGDEDKEDANLEKNLQRRMAEQRGIRDARKKAPAPRNKSTPAPASSSASSSIAGGVFDDDSSFLRSAGRDVVDDNIPIHIGIDINDGDSILEEERRAVAREAGWQPPRGNISRRR